MLAIVIPTYNEKENLPVLVKRINSLEIGKPRLIVVDDDSPDGTGQVADELAKKHGNIDVIHRKVKGRATAGLDGFRHALRTGADLIMEMDADLSHDPGEIPRFLAAIKNCDVVVGSRYGRGQMERGFSRNVISDFANWYNRVLLGLKIRDVSGGFKLYRREVMESLDFDEFVSTGYSIGAETLYRINRKGFRIKEIPITFRDRVHGESKMDFRQMINYAFKILQIRFFS